MVFLLAVLLADAPAAPPGSPAESPFAALLARLPADDRDFLARARYAGKYRPSEIVTYTAREGRYYATFHLPERLARQFHDPDPLLIALEGSPHAWSLHRRRASTIDDALSLVTLTCYAPDVNWPFNRFAVSSDGSVDLLVSAAQMFGPPAFRPTVGLTQGRQLIRLSYRIEPDKYQPRRLEVLEPVHIDTRAAGFTDKYLVPVYRQLGAGRPASDVYRVFDRIPADPAVTRKVLPLVARLDAEDAADREAALRALGAMGRPAVLATLRLDPAALSAEQRSRLGALWAADGWVHHPDLTAAARDPAFLASCLEDEDPQVRAAAETTLAAFRALGPAEPGAPR